jgi:RNA polymerase sigma-70 factor (ECF subfamily)
LFNVEERESGGECNFLLYHTYNRYTRAEVMILHDDNRLMELVKGGDKEAYNSIVIKYRVSAISFAYSFVHDLYAAEDIVQDVFVNIYIKRYSYHPVCGFKTFLFQAIRNKSIDYLRRTKTRAAVDINSLTELVSCSTEEAFLQTEKEKLIFELMSKLKNDYKTALYLFAVESESYAEIAKIMKKTIPQVKILIFRARKKLKNQYLEVFGDEE